MVVMNKVMIMMMRMMTFLMMLIMPMVVIDKVMMMMMIGMNLRWKPYSTDLRTSSHSNRTSHHV